MSTSCLHQPQTQGERESGSRPHPEANVNNVIPREQAVQLLQDLIAKASIRLHDAMRKSSSSCQSASPPAQASGHTSKPATLRQMQRLLDRLGSEAYKELEQQLGFKSHVEADATHLIACSHEGSLHMPKPARASSHRPPQPTTENNVAGNVVVDAGTSSECVDADCTVAQAVQPAAGASVLCAFDDSNKLNQDFFMNHRIAPEFHSTHNVHIEQRTGYLGGSRRPGSPSRPPCFDVYQGYRQRGASRRTNLNLQEHESGVSVCWVPGGKHQGTFNKYGAMQAAAGINRKTCVGDPSTPAKYRSSSAQLRHADRSRSRPDIQHLQISHTFPPACDALAGERRTRVPAKCQQNPMIRSLQCAARPAASTDMLDSPQARLTFDLRASRLIDPNVTAYKASRQRSFSNPPTGNDRNFPLAYTAAPGNHRRKWPEQDRLRLTLDDQQQGTGRMMSPTDTTTSTSHSGLERGKSSSNIDVPRSPEDCPSTTDSAAASPSEPLIGRSQAPSCGHVVQTSTEESPMAKTTSSQDDQQLDESDAERHHMNASSVARVACGGKQDVQGMPGCRPGGNAGLPVTDVLPSRAPHLGPSPERLLEKGPSEDAEREQAADTHNKSYRMIQDDNLLNHGRVRASTGLEQLDDAEPPSTVWPRIDHVLNVHEINHLSSPTHGDVSNTPLSAVGTAERLTSQEIFNGSPTDGNVQLRRHLDKAYRIVNHLSNSAELMQKLHDTASIPGGGALKGADVRVTSDHVHPSHGEQRADAGDQQAWPLSPGRDGVDRVAAEMMASHVSPHGPSCARANQGAGGPCKGSSHHQLAHAATFSGIQGERLSQWSSWEHSCAAQVQFGRSRSLNAAAAGRSHKPRPSDAIVNRVDEIQRSVERLRRVHIATKSSESVSNG